MCDAKYAFGEKPDDCMQGHTNSGGPCRRCENAGYKLKMHLESVYNLHRKEASRTEYGYMRDKPVKSCQMGIYGFGLMQQQRPVNLRRGRPRIEIDSRSHTKQRVRQTEDRHPS